MALVLNFSSLSKDTTVNFSKFKNAYLKHCTSPGFKYFWSISKDFFFNPEIHFENPHSPSFFKCYRKLNNGINMQWKRTKWKKMGIELALDTELFWAESQKDNNTQN